MPMGLVLNRDDAYLPVVNAGVNAPRYGRLVYTKFKGPN
jgi:hypothetical protein